ncbi:MAG: hypothetical protein MR308_04350 [Lachnospiraceae bacterium]|nr:hypothetical protein [Lachnospiraceae bacterium]
MNTYDVKCPVCGVVNHSLFLEETDGWMECEHCGHAAKYCWEPQTKKQIPVFVIRNLQALSTPKSFDPKTPVKNDRNRRVPERRCSYRRVHLTPG